MSIKERKRHFRLARNPVHVSRTGTGASAVQPCAGAAEFASQTPEVTASASGNERPKGNERNKNEFANTLVKNYENQRLLRVFRTKPWSQWTLAGSPSLQTPSHNHVTQSHVSPSAPLRVLTRLGTTVYGSRCKHQHRQCQYIPIPWPGSSLWLVVLQCNNPACDSDSENELER